MINFSTLFCDFKNLTLRTINLLACMLLVAGLSAFTGSANENCTDGTFTAMETPINNCSTIELKVVNDSDCPVRLYHWVESGDIFLTTIIAGDAYAVSAEVDQMYRVINTNQDWNNLLFDEHITVTESDDCIQTWTITPTYCGPDDCILGDIVTVTSTDATCAEVNGSITFAFPNSDGRTQIAFSLDGGTTWKQNVTDKSGDVTYNDLTEGTYDLMVRWGDTDCPTSLGAVVIAGDTPFASVTSTDATCGENTGSITFTFPNAVGRTHIDFSLNGGISWTANISDLLGSKTYGNLAEGTYDVMTRWGNNECPVSLGQVLISSNTATPGTACDDNNFFTVNDVILADGCSCEGTEIVLVVDGDGDGIPLDEDCDDADPLVPTTPGTACDDNNSNTYNDVILADGCSCEGTPATTDCKTYTIKDVQPVCHSAFEGLDAGVFYRRSVNSDGLCAGTTFEVWTAGSDLVLVENGDGTAQMSGTIINGNTVATVALSYTGFSATGAGWVNACYNNNLTLDYYYTGFAGTVSYDGQSYTLIQKGADVVMGQGAQNADDGFGFGMWIDGTWGECIEAFGSLTLKQAGDSCDDKNANTENDVYSADGCTCAGTEVVVVDEICDADYSVAGSAITVTGLDEAMNMVQILDENWNVLYECNSWSTPCDVTTVFDDLTAGSYMVSIQTTDAAWGQVCNITEAFTIEGEANPCANTVTDSGVIAGAQTGCAPFNPENITSTSSASGGSGTIEYLWLSSTNGCPGSISQVIDGATGETYNPGVLTETTYFRRCSRRVPCEEWYGVGESNCIKVVVNESGTPGDTCDDNNPNTSNDVYQADGCSCKGEFAPGTAANIVIGDAVVNEDDGTATLTITIDQVLAADLTIEYTASDDSADGTDYVAQNGILTIPAGSLTGTITFTILDDNTAESTKDFTITLSNPSAGTIVDGIGVITILDTDEGTTTPSGDCSAAYTVDGNSITVTGLVQPITMVQILDMNWEVLTGCSTWETACNTTEIFSDLADGEYMISIQTSDAAWNSICNMTEPFTIGEVAIPVDFDCRKYKVSDSTPACGEDFEGTGVFFRRDCGISFEVWTAGDDLMLEEHGDGTATLSGSIINDNTIAQVNIAYTGYNTTGNNWVNACYNEGMIEEYFYTGFSGTVTYDDEVFTLEQKSTGKDFVFGNGANNTSADEFGFGGWLDGTWGNCVEAFGKLTPIVAGDTCDDGNAATSNDVILADGCTCAGEGVVVPTDCAVTYVATDDLITVSNLTDPIIAVKVLDENFNVAYECNAWATACNTTEVIEMLSPGTYFLQVQTYDAAWNNICELFEEFTIEGTVSDDDADGDGVLTEDDCDDNDASIPATVGSSCNDNNASTENDKILADGCSCEGTPTVALDCDVEVTTDGTEIVISGMTAPIVSTKVIDTDWTYVYECGTMVTACNETEVIEGLAAGTYFVSVQTYDAAWNAICNIWVEMTIEGTDSGIVDNDNDGIPADKDCNDNDATVPATVGTSCNDNNANTEDDKILSDGCTCAGIPVDVISCQDEMLAYYSLDNCVSDADGEKYIYDEFTADDVNFAGYNNVTAENIHRDNGVQYCTPGVDSPAMSIGSANTCTFGDSDWNEYALEFDLTVDAAQTGAITGFEFQEQAPTQFDFIDGADGDNNYSTKYAVRVLKDGVTIYEDYNINTTADWSTETFNFAGDADFQVTGTTTFTFQLRSYCRIDNGASVAVWNVDEFKVFGGACNGSTDNTTICNEREVSDVINCSHGRQYGFFLASAGNNNYYLWDSAELIEYDNGTATLTGRAVNSADENFGFDVVMNFTGRSNNPNEFGVKEHSCLTPDYNSFYYYNNFTGTIAGFGDLEGLAYAIQSYGNSFQAGYGANATGDNLEFGASAWWSTTLLSEADNGTSFTLTSTNYGPTGGGDINILLSGDDSSCSNVLGMIAATNNEANEASSKLGSTTATTNRNNTDTNDLISEVAKVANFSIFPNPATEYVNIEVSEFAGQDVQVMVFNTIGVQTYNNIITDLNDNVISIDLAQYGNGAYTVIFQADGNVTTKKFIVTKQ